jgi:hypothetical protein
MKGTPEAVDDSASTNEGVVVDIAVLGNDRDPERETLRLVSVTQGANGSVLINGDDTVRYQPNEGFTGLDGFAYTVADGQGETATASVSVWVQDIPDVPLAEDQVLQSDEDTELAITLAGSDADGDRLTFRIQRPPAEGSLRGTPPDLAYLPNVDYSGLDGFVFVVEDGHGGRDTGRVSITILPVNDAPEAVDDSAATTEGLVVDIGVLSNDRDPEGEALRLVSVTQGANGSVLINGDDTVRYQPNEGFTGSDGFAYTVADDQGETATASVSVVVKDIADR